MTHKLLRRASVTMLALASLVCAEPKAPRGRVRLFNGRDLTNFYVSLRDNHRQDPKGVFTVQHGVLRVSGEEWGGLTTVEEWRDYRLLVEWRWGEKTWGAREKRARDSGILLHGVGEDGAAGNGWLQSIEYQIIEGGVGDLILVRGKDRPSVTAETRAAGRETYWQAGGTPVTRNTGRIDWYGRDPQWKDVIGFRGAQDVDRPHGQWNRSEIVARGGDLEYYVNGKLVNRASACSQPGGKIQIQSEGAEIFVRRIELRPAR
jgi:hypothetical protein